MSPLVLVVDDDEVVRAVIAETLRMDGMDVASASDGRGALTCLRHEPRPALMLLDLMMPVMNGWQVLDEMNRETLSEHMPVVVLTAFDALDDLPAGCHVLHKPIDVEVLLGLVHALLHGDAMQALVPDARRAKAEVRHPLRSGW